MGQSAGGGSVQYHTIAYGGVPQAGENDLFAGAIAQSPAPCFSDDYHRCIGANKLLEAAGVNNVDDLRKVDEKVLATANVKAQAEAPATVITFGELIQQLNVLTHNTD